MEIAKLIISVLGFGGTILALAFGLRQYRRAEQWKRSEFIAKEIKEFESNPTTRNAMLLIDWGERRVNLFLAPNPSPADYIKITREDQWRALLPPPLKPKYLSLAEEAAEVTDAREEPKRKFTPAEARIRDTYDAFLDHLERFANFIESGLVTPEEFRPYLIYWIDSVANVENIDVYEGDAEWRCVLLTYINYYRYSGVKSLFKVYGWDIEPGSEVYVKLKGLMENKKLQEELADCLKRRKLMPSGREGQAKIEAAGGPSGGPVGSAARQ